jgi:hypothetical protein
MTMTSRSFMTRVARPGVAVLALFSIAACVTEPPPVAMREEAPPPSTDVYFYPAQGRTDSAEQQDRDKYECHAWAVQKTGFDPSLPNVPPHQRVRVVAAGPPPGADVATGAVTGAVVGAAVSNPWHTGKGAVLGAIAGAAIGGIADAERTAEANRIEDAANARAHNAQAAAFERRATDYRRAMMACLEGRGYSVR